MLRVFLAFIIAIAPTIGAAQSVSQSGTVTPGHAAMWATNGVIKDAGTAANGFFSSLGTQGPGPTICANSGPITGPYQQLCLNSNTASAGKITLNPYGGATAQPLQLCTAGVCVTVPTSGGSGTIPTITTPTVLNALICAADTNGNLVDCPAMTNGQLLVGQTGSAPLPKTMSGDISSISAAGAVTLGKVNGVTFPSSYSSNVPLIYNGSSIATATRSGSTTVYATTSGTLTNGNCVSIDSSGNLVAAGGACTTGGGGGTVTSATAGQIPWYSSTGTTVVGNAHLTVDSSGNLVVGGSLTTSITGSTQCLKVNSSGLASGTGGNCASAGMAGNIQLSDGSSGFTDGGSNAWRLQVPACCSTPTGYYMVGGGTGCTGCSGTDLAIISGSSYQPGGHAVVIGDVVFNGIGHGAGSVAVVSEGGTVNYNHCTAMGNAINCNGSESVTVGFGATVTGGNGTGAIAIGEAAVNGGAGAVAINGTGNAAASAITISGTVNAGLSIALGINSSTGVGHTYSMALGANAATTAQGQVAMSPNWTDIWLGDPATGAQTVVHYQDYLPSTTFTVAGLGACSSGSNKYIVRFVTDANSPTWNTTLSGGGSGAGAAVFAICDGVSWKAH